MKSRVSGEKRRRKRQRRESINLVLQYDDEHENRSEIRFFLIFGTDGGQSGRHSFFLKKDNSCTVYFCPSSHMGGYRGEIRMLKRKERLQRIAENLELPKGPMTNCLQVNICGEEQVWVENHLGILEYTQRRLSFKTEAGKVVITGEKLLLESMGNGEAKVCGEIASVAFSKGM